MIRDYELKTDENGTYAVIVRGDVRIEVPHDGDEVAVQEKIDTALLQIALTEFKECPVKDDVYVDGSIVRQDYSLITDEGQAILSELETAFPNYASYTRNRFNIVGKYEGYREPYENPSISWYDCGIKPSTQLQSSFNVSYSETDLKEWYGVKFDLVTKDVLLKIVVNSFEEDTPELPTGEIFYAITHSQDGTSSEWVDAYVYASPKRIREFCAAKGLQYPLLENSHTEYDVIWCWGFVFNTETLEYGAVKAYARENMIAPHSFTTRN